MKSEIKKSERKLLGEEEVYYDDVKLLLDDYMEYQVTAKLVKEKQAATNRLHISQVWKAVDPPRKVFPVNEMGDWDKLEAMFFNPQIKELQTYNVIDNDEKAEYIVKNGRPLQASTLNLHLLNVLNFFETLQRIYFVGYEMTSFQ